MILHSLFTKCILNPQNVIFVRNLRSVALRGVVPQKRSEDNIKTISGKVKTVTEFDDSEPHIGTYKDFIRSIEKSKLGDELEVEKHFLNEDYHGDVFERCETYYDMHEDEEKHAKSVIKKKIIGRKYFKLEKETNLLTHAAKEQIRYLHKLNPVEWNCKTLSERFPTSEEGVKKLLKSNFVQTCPEKIKLHDEDVARKWEILKSGKPTNEIRPLTQKLYKEGKLVDDYFSGNPNLPTLPPPDKKVIEIKKREEIGEFSAIVKSYVDYKQQKLLESKAEYSSEKQVSLKDPKKPKKSGLTDTRKFKYSDVHDDGDSIPQVYPTRLKKTANIGEIPFSEFKEALKEEATLKSKSKYKNEYDDFVIEETSKKDATSLNKISDSKNCFLKIPKYKNENVDVTYEKNKNVHSVYKYDEKLGYQYPVGKSIKGKIYVSSKRNGKKLHRIGSCIYDENGEFLYRVL